MRVPASQPLQDEAKEYMDRHDWQGAVPLLELDIIDHPQDPWSQMFLGSCFLELKNFTLALEHFRTAEGLAPDDSTPIGCQGDVLCAAGDWEQAGEFYRKALALNPDNELAIKNWNWWTANMSKAKLRAASHGKEPNSD